MRTFFLLLLLLPSIFGRAQRIATGPAPAWITHTELDYTQTDLDESAADGYIDLAFEKQVSVGTQTVFIRTARRVLSDAGVENASEVSIDYDPSFERVIVHTVQLRRDGRIIDKLRPTRFQVMRQEKERGEHLYSGQLSAVLLLDDVRQGDVIEYSYSIKGFNPVFGDRYATGFDTRFSVPVYHLYYKLIAPAGHNLAVRNRGEAPAAEPISAGTERGWEWHARNCKALTLEDHVPAWYDPFPVIEVSEWRSWKEVVDWACTLFPATQPAGVLKRAAAWKAGYTTDAERTVAALRFVEEEVRYLGIETGAGTHRPTAPEKVLAQRFGDCKDKSYLLCTLLRAMGIEAWPVLTNTEDKHAVKGWLPTPSAFDHCTVQARVGGRTYWLDPTSTGQRGTLDQISYPNYEVGLVVRAGESDFSTVALQEKGRVAVTEKFELPRFDAPARLLVTTVYTGSWAELNRDDFHSARRSDKLKEFQAFYAAYFDQVKADSIRYVDDEQANRITVQEYYTIRDIWKKKESGAQRLSIAPFVINSYLRKPRDLQRSMPFALEYPMAVSEQVVLDLPDNWEMDDFNEVYAAPGFRVTSAGKSEGRQVSFSYTYETNKDHVAAADIDAYMTAYRNADENLAYSLTYNSDGVAEGTEHRKILTPRRNYTPFSTRDLYPLLYVLLALAVFITWRLRRSR